MANASRRARRRPGKPILTLHPNTFQNLLVGESHPPKNEQQPVALTAIGPSY